MQFYRCKCGKASTHTSTGAPRSCEGCEECKTTMVAHPEEPQPLGLHDIVKTQTIVTHNGVEEANRTKYHCNRCGRRLKEDGTVMASHGTDLHPTQFIAPDAETSGGGAAGGSNPG